MRLHAIELHIEWVTADSSRDPLLRSERPEFRCARCGGDVDYGAGGWEHVERMGTANPAAASA